jgi:hypothetical protein
VTTVSAGADAQPVSAGSDRLPDMEFAEFFRAEHKKLIRFVTTMGANSDQARHGRCARRAGQRGR